MSTQATYFGSGRAQRRAPSARKELGLVGITTRSLTATPGSIRSMLAGQVSTSTQWQPSLIGSSVASRAALTSNGFEFLRLAASTDQRGSPGGSRSSNATRRRFSMARAARAVSETAWEPCGTGQKEGTAGRRKGDDVHGGLIVVSIKWLWYWLRFPRVTRLAVRLKLPPPGREQLFRQTRRSAGQLADMHYPCGMRAL